MSLLQRRRAVAGCTRPDTSTFDWKPHANNGVETARFGVKYAGGDEITVRLDLDASTVAIRMSGVDVGSPQELAGEGAYCFAIKSIAGSGATIVDVIEVVA